MAACESRPTRTLRLLVNEENSFKLSVAREIAASFSAAGIDMTVTALPWADYTVALAAGSFDLYYGEVRLTADWNLAPLLATGGRLNYGGWSDARCDQLLEAARSALDQKAALSTLCRYLQLQTPILPVCFKSVSVLYAANTVSGLSPTAAEPFYELQDITIQLRNG